MTLKEGGRPVWIRNVDLNIEGGKKNAYALGLQVGILEKIFLAISIS